MNASNDMRLLITSIADSTGGEYMKHMSSRYGWLDLRRNSTMRRPDCRNG